MTAARRSPSSAADAAAAAIRSTSSVSATAATIEPVSARRDHARRLFAPIGPTYDRVGAVLSLGQDPRWRRFLVSRLTTSTARGHVLDVATGTGLVAMGLMRRGFDGTGVARSKEMWEVARARVGGHVQ